MKLNKPVAMIAGAKCQCFKSGKPYYNLNFVAKGAAEFEVEDDVTEIVYSPVRAGQEAIATHIWSVKGTEWKAISGTVEEAVESYYPKLEPKPVKKEFAVASDQITRK